MSKFGKEAACWVGKGLPDGWVGLAQERLRPLEALGVVVTGTATEVTVKFPDPEGGLRLVVVAGATQGVVYEGDAAGALVVCLMALRRLGGIDLVDDESKMLPNAVRQSSPLFAADWERVRSVAETLGLVAGREFMARNQAVLQRLI